MTSQILRCAAAAAAATVALALAGAPIAQVAYAQLPGGLDPAVAKDMIPGQISVRAGETTTVDVGVPVDVSYSSNGWVVSSSGTAVSVTAPNQPGSTASVQASAMGYSTTINLVAVGDGEATALDEEESGAEGPGAAQDAPESESSSDAGDAGGAGGASGTGGAAVAHPPRQQATPVDTANAKRLYFDGKIDGNRLVVKVPLSRAPELMQYRNVDQDGATLRYVDVNGQIIEGVKRDIDVAARTLTLTYPEGETPDNPFIMEVVRDGAAAEFIAVITASNADVEKPESSNAYSDAAESQADSPDSGSMWVPFAIGGVALLVLLALLVTVLRRRGTGRA